MPEQNQKSKLSLDNTEIAFKRISTPELKKTYWLFRLISNPVLSAIGPFFTKAAFYFKLPVEGLIKSTLFKQFCGGETIEECTPKILRLYANRVGTILDYSVEGEQVEKVFDQTTEQVLNSIKKSNEFPEAIPFCVFKLTGLMRFCLLEKVSQKLELVDNEQVEWQNAMNRIEMICNKASEAHQPIMIDAEESWIQGAIDEIVIALMQKYNQTRAIVFNSYQLYRHDKLSSLIADVTLAQTRHFILGAKLVRGAYLEKERKRALEKGYLSPIHLTKKATDTDFNIAVSFCLDNLKHINVVVATHNQYSCEVLAEKMEQGEIPNNHPNIYFAQLLGMSDNISFNLGACGYNVAKYVPFGPVKSVLPYLLRRAEENSAIAGQMSRELSLIDKELKRRKVG